MDATEPAHGTEAVVLLLRGRDRRSPVGDDTELLRIELDPVAGGGKDDRGLREVLGSLTQDARRLGGRQAADVDAGDLRAVGEGRARARIREPERDREHADERREDESTAHCQPGRGSPPDAPRSG